MKVEVNAKVVSVLAILIIAVLLTVTVTGCSATGGNDTENPAEQTENGTGIHEGIPPGEKGEIGNAGGKNDNTGREESRTGDPCAKDWESGTGNSHVPEGPGSISEKLGKMSLDEKIGQMFIIGVDGTSVDEDMKNVINSRKPGGIILFSGNITGPEQLTDFMNAMKAANSGNIPLFVSIDEEGGRITRLPEQLTALPSAMSVGEIDDAAFTYRIGRLLAAKIKAFGINMDFAPVLDIFSNPNNTVIGDRAYGTTPQSVEKHGIQVMKGLRDEGIVAVVKHFPGHGDTDADSHYGLPSVGHNKDRLAGFELIPFRKAFSEDADAVMVAHILVESLDRDLPASLSPVIIGGLLREEMGFDGVVITDDMTMRAITDNFDIGEAAVRSVVAGSDIILVCHGRDRQAEAMDAVKKAVEEGVIDEARIDESVARILKLKEKYGLNDNAVGYPDVDRLNEKIEGVLSKWYNSKWYNDN